VINFTHTVARRLLKL